MASFNETRETIGTDSSTTYIHKTSEQLAPEYWERVNEVPRVQVETVEKTIEMHTEQLVDRVIDTPHGLKPALDENGKLVLDEHGNEMFIPVNGQGSEGLLKLVVDKNGNKILDENGLPIYVPASSIIDENGDPQFIPGFNATGQLLGGPPAYGMDISGNQLNHKTQFVHVVTREIPKIEVQVQHRIEEVETVEYRDKYIEVPEIREVVRRVPRVIVHEIPIERIVKVPAKPIRQEIMKPKFVPSPYIMQEPVLREIPIPTVQTQTNEVVHQIASN